MTKGDKLIYLVDSNHFIATAVSNRVLSEVKGLLAHGIEIELISLGLENSSNVQFISEDKTFKTKFYFKKRKSRYINFILKRITSFLFFFDMIFKKKITIYQYGLTPRLIWILSILRDIKKIILIREIAEYPKFISNNQRVNLIRKLYIKKMVRSCDCMVVISQALFRFVREYSDVNTIVVNMTVDTERFTYGNEKQENVISYCGDMSGNKDGVPNLIKAFSIFNKKTKENYRLRLIGNISNNTLFNSLNEVCRKVGEIDNIEFTGKVDREKIPELLAKSKMLTLCRPATKQAEGGFPTKLGEYLATGNPVVVTNVGEISLFIKDGVNGFLAKSDEPIVFAEKMLEVVADYEKATKIGIAGKELTNLEFNPFVQMSKISEYLLGLENRNFKLTPPKKKRIK